MGISTISNVSIAGIASALPEQVRTCEQDGARFGLDEVRKICASTGVHRRHVAPAGICTSDLCYAAAARLLDELGWPPASVDLLIFVSQSPDFALPATSCLLHSRLDLPKSCAAFDISLGCSGWVYGLWVASGMAASTGVNRALLLTGDTSVRTISPDDRSAALLFGDAGTATAIQRDESAPPSFFCLGSDGTGAEHLMIKAGQFRHPRSAATSVRTLREGSNVRSDEDLFMNGAEVFTFTLREVPGLLKTVLGCAGWSIADTDAFVMHQANQFMLSHLAKFVKIPPEKLVLELTDYGNTSSASIPLAMGVSPICRPLLERQLKLVVAGFGVGFSWAAAAISCGPVALPPPVLV